MATFDVNDDELEKSENFLDSVEEPVTETNEKESYFPSHQVKVEIEESYVTKKKGSDEPPKVRDHNEPAIKNKEPIISLLRENNITVEQILEFHEDLFNNVAEGKVAETDEGYKWTAAILEALAHTMLENTPRKATEREGSVWTNTLKYGDHSLRGGQPKLQLPNRKLTNDETLLFLSHKANIGAPYDVFLPRSGIWVKIRTPTLTEIAALHTKLGQLKISLGAESKGAIYSNAQSLLLNIVTSLALSCVVASNYKFNTPTDLEHVIDVMDEPFLHHGLAAALYPDGFNYSHPCVADPTTCNHVEEAKLNMSTLTWYDKLCFSEGQLQHISKRFNPCSEDDLKAYSEGFRINTSKIIRIGQIGIRLAIPKIAHRRLCGDRWIDSIIDQTEGSFNEPVHGPQRGAYIERLKNITAARQFTHFVDKLYTLSDDDSEEPEEIPANEDIIERFLSDVVSDQEYLDMFNNEVQDFINQSIVGIIALKNWNCPVCKSPAAKKFHERLPHLVPVDMLSTFFTLAGKKQNRVK